MSVGKSFDSLYNVIYSLVKDTTDLLIHADFISSFLCQKGFPMQEYEDLKQLVAAAEEDIIKAEGGNKAAGTRVRKQMQDIKQAAQQVRLKILEQRVEA